MHRTSVREFFYRLSSVVSVFVCVCVCLSGITIVNCKNGRIDRDAVWSVAHGAEETIIRRRTKFQEIGVSVGRV